jgi:hypothetical protein
MAVFWTDLDDYMVGLFTAQMGAASSYTTLKARTINKRIFSDMFEWPLWTLPAIAVSCYQVVYIADEHMGAGNKLYKKTYRCAAFGLVSGVVNYESSPVTDTVTDAVKEFYERMEAVLRMTPFSVQSAGVTTRSATINQGHIDVMRYANDDNASTKRFGVAHFQFDVTARV